MTARLVGSRRLAFYFLTVIAASEPLFALEPSSPVAFPELVTRMIDLQALANAPETGERNAMWSSYDRGAKYDAQSGQYLQWYANGDGSGLIRHEGESQVIAEMEGPGVVWRIWSAKPEAGHVKIYLDGKVAVDMPFAHFFDAAHAPFDYASLSYESGRGKNLYFPIPYQKSCKIVAEPGWGRYYQITYSTFPKATQLPTLAAASSPESFAALRQVDEYFRQQLGSDPAGTRKGETSSSVDVSVKPGETVEVACIDGPRAITALRVKSSFEDRDDQMTALRRLVLQITWDGQDSPAVWCPLGDFFGTAPGVNKYRSLPLGMTDDGFYSLWYMPFGESAKIELISLEEADRKVQFQITHAPLDRPADQLLRFHAKWHRDVMPLGQDRWPDWTVMRSTGRGRFCGMMLHVWNPRGGRCADVEWCSGHWWWGEGDEKFFVDGEKFPSTFGTGTEDYFGYAWGCADAFQHPYNNQTMTEGNAGHQSVNRFQILDNVPFQKSFEGTLEKYFPNEQPTLYAVTAYWYLSPDGSDPHSASPAEQLDGYYVRPPTICGGHEVIDMTGGRVQTQGMGNRPGATWKDDDQLWWTGAQIGDKLTIRISVAQAGDYSLQTVLTKARDYARVRLSLDGHALGEAIDLYNPEVIRAEPISLGTHSLAAGEHDFCVEIVGKNESAVPSYMFGLDELLLQTD